MRKDQVCLVALGGNLPRDGQEPAQTLWAAVDDLVGLGARIIAVSRFFKTPCFPAGAGPDYVNAALVMQVPGDARAVLDMLHKVEAMHDRERHTRWAGRTLDLDLIAVGDTVQPDADTQARWRDLPLEAQMQEAPDQLILPHPRIQDRAFVLIPLMDVAPDWLHPLLGVTVAQMADALPQEMKDEVVPL